MPGQSTATSSSRTTKGHASQDVHGWRGFTPANRNVLFGYQFKSVAALGPILGPIIAVQWGWLPALLWIVVGTFFIGWVQDYASIMIGVREEGKSFGALSYELISPVPGSSCSFSSTSTCVDHGRVWVPGWL